jgi:hypothetical protein
VSDHLAKQATYQEKRKERTDEWFRAELGWKQQAGVHITQGDRDLARASSTPTPDTRQGQRSTVVEASIENTP